MTRLGCLTVAFWAAFSSISVQAADLHSVGSDTLRPLMEIWSDRFLETHRDFTAVNIDSPGSGAAPEAMARGAAHIAPMSRKMTKEELAHIAEARGAEPIGLIVALDALEVYVNADNPWNGATLRQLDSIFSHNQDCGGPAIESWSALIFGALAEEPIELHSRNETSGTYEVFKERALCGGAFRDGAIYHEDSEAVVVAVAAKANAIGYAGLGYEREGVKPLAIARHSEDNYVPAIPERLRADKDPERRFKNVMSGEYPLTRRLYLYIAPDDAAAAQFAAFALSSEGQTLVMEAGYVPLPPQTLDKERTRLDLGEVPLLKRITGARWWPL